jgi:phosphatidate cytidylyltransferase
METPQDNPPTSRWRGLGTRIMGVIPLVMLAVLCVVWGGFAFSVLVLLAAIVMLKEWEKLTQPDDTLFKLLGYVLTIVPCACLLWLRSLTSPVDDLLGMKLVLALIAIIAATDIGAYFTGKSLGHYKLAPVISPNKTWEGLAGGVFASIFTAALVLPYALPLPLFSLFGIGMLLSLLAQAGDLLESWAKRRAGVKDSGSLIPGHGGLLDRVDGYLLSAPAFALLVHFCGV